MHDLDLILTLTSGLTAALILGYATFRLGLSPIVGYLLAGFAIGPHVAGFLADNDLANQLAEIGIILLMFGVGLQFHFRELMEVRRVAVPGALFQSLIATILGCLVAREFGWSWSAGLVFGMAISVASTVVLLRVLMDNNALHTPAGHIAVGWLVVEDMFTIIALVLLPVFSGTGGAGSGDLTLSLGWSFLKLGLLVAFTFWVGGRLIPMLLDHVAMTHSRELFMLAVLVLALGIAVGAAEVFGVSMALGAFLAGMVVGKSEFSLRAASEALPMRDAFSVLFFVSVGMLFDPHSLLESPGLVVATLCVILLGKPLAAFAIMVLLRYPLRTALSVSVALAQIGEFSFILAALGKQLGILGSDAANTVISASIASISLNPLLYRLIDPIEALVKKRPRLWGWLNARVQAALRKEHGQDSMDAAVHAPRYRAVVIGYGPIGQTVCRLLQENEIEPAVIEMNIETVRRLKSAGMSAVYGDASHRDTLKSAGVESAVTLVLSAAGMHNAKEVIRLARELNPKISIFIRTAFLGEIEAFCSAGADAVFSGEGETALAMTEFILRRLGATAEQIDRERDRVRMELFGRLSSSCSIGLDDIEQRTSFDESA